MFEFVADIIGFILGEIARRIIGGVFIVVLSPFLFVIGVIGYLIRYRLRGKATSEKRNYRYYVNIGVGLCYEAILWLLILGFFAFLVLVLVWVIRELIA
jgi:hypothetical protein